MTDDRLTPSGDALANGSADTAVAEPTAPEPAGVPTQPEAPAELLTETPASTDPVAETAAPDPIAETATENPVVESALPETPPAPVEHVAPATPAPAATSDKTEDELLFEQALAGFESGATTDTTYKKLAKGDKVEATVIQVDRDKVFVDLGTKSEGVVPLNELSEAAIESAHDHVKVGDKITVVVIKPEGSDGNAIVSKKRADFEETWNRVVRAFEDGEPVTAQVVDRVKGGLVVDLGVRGFVPATHVGSGKLRNIEKYVGQPLELKILEIDRERKKVVLSNKLAEEEKSASVKENFFTEVSPGDVLEGTVRRLADYGAFIDLGGIDGLLHISEMSWMRINHPREVLKVGQKIKVMVLRLDQGTGKISLGLRQVLPDPWNLIRENYKIGQKIATKITRLVQSGAFVRLPEGAEAFLPISEMAPRRIAKPTDVLTEGEEVELTIIDLRPEERRMVLSLRAGMAPDYSQQQGYGGPGGYGGDRGGFGDDRRRKGGKGRKGNETEDQDRSIMGRMPTGGATIGERLGMLKGMFGGADVEETEEEKVEAAPSEPGAPAVPVTSTEPEATPSEPEAPVEEAKADEE